MGRRPEAFPTRAPQRAQVTASLSGEGCLSSGFSARGVCQKPGRRAMNGLA